MKKYIAEAIGTCVLVVIGCGTAMFVGCDSANGCGYVATALAFGLAIVMMAYSIGNISGCHVNPAVSLGFLMTGQMSFKDFWGYVIGQVLGAIIGTGILDLISVTSRKEDLTQAFGANTLSGVNGHAIAGLIVEIVLTFIFVLAILGVTSKKGNHGHFGGLIIGLTLTGIHLVGIGLTGTSVNPARSIAPALFAAIEGNTEPISCLWVFIVAPLIGGALAAVTWNAIDKENA